MTKEEFDKRKRKLEVTYREALWELQKEYAHANNPYQVGDILEDHFHLIKVERLEVSATTGVSEIRYHGTELKKDLTPKKRQLDTYMYQSNVVRKLNK